MKCASQSLIVVEYLSLLMMVLNLAIFEAPKNIFLVIFLCVAFLRVATSAKSIKFDLMDWMFFLLILSSFLSAIFPGMHYGQEWKGVRILLTAVLTGFFVARSNFSEKQRSTVFLFAIISLIPALLWAFFDLFILKREYLELHSVGHVNHSAIYIAIIYGSAVGLLVALWNRISYPMFVFLNLFVIFLYVSLVVGQSRAALGIGFITSVSLIILSRLDKKKKVLLGAMILGISLLAVLTSAKVVNKELSNEKTHYVLSGRDKIWNTALEAWREYPLLGIGNGNFKAVTPGVVQALVEARGGEYTPENYIFIGHPHSLYMSALVERGLAGVVALMFFFLGWLFILVKGYKASISSIQGAYLWAGSFSAWMVTFGVGLVNSTFHHEHGILACLLLGLHVCYLRDFYSKQTTNYEEDSVYLRTSHLT